MKTKTTICCAAVFSSIVLFASNTPEVEDVVMSQASFGRMVTVTYKLNNASAGAVVTFDVETNCTVNGETKWASIGGEAVCNAGGAVWRKVTAADADAQGRYRITWRPDLSWEGHKVSLEDGGARAVVTAWALDNTPDYMVVDISSAARPHTQRYYPSAEFLPGIQAGQSGAITNNPLYKTSAVVMRKIMAKDVTWTAGSTELEYPDKRKADREATHQVTLTNNYYIGVFEVTQAQWALVQTAFVAPSYFNNVEARSTRPVEQVSYNEIRNAANSTDPNAAHYWPADPNPGSYLGLLRARTGLDFDLPTEAQWEFAARAGIGDSKWNDGSGIQCENKDTNLDRLGRYERNGGKIMYMIDKWENYKVPDQGTGTENGTASVGSYLPNGWGLYDMHGNVTEWCLDWYEHDVVDNGGKVNIDPENPSFTLSGADGNGWGRSARGGCWYESAPWCRPAYRSGGGGGNRNNYTGFRLKCCAGLQ